MDGGSWQSGGAVSADPGNTTMLYDFSSITLGAGVSFTASGNYALGLLATGNITISDDLDLAGQNGSAGSNGYGDVGGGGGGGGGAILIDSTGGTISLSGTLDIAGRDPGAQGRRGLAAALADSAAHRQPEGTVGRAPRAAREAGVAVGGLSEA